MAHADGKNDDKKQQKGATNRKADNDYKSNLFARLLKGFEIKLLSRASLGTTFKLKKKKQVKNGGEKLTD